MKNSFILAVLFFSLSSCGNSSSNDPIKVKPVQMTEAESCGYAFIEESDAAVSDDLFLQLNGDWVSTASGKLLTKDPAISNSRMSMELGGEFGGFRVVEVYDSKTKFCRTFAFRIKKDFDREILSLKPISSTSGGGRRPFQDYFDFAKGFTEATFTRIN